MTEIKEVAETYIRIASDRSTDVSQNLQNSLIPIDQVVDIAPVVPEHTHDLEQEHSDSKNVSDAILSELDCKQVLVDEQEVADEHVSELVLCEKSSDSTHDDLNLKREQFEENKSHNFSPIKAFEWCAFPNGKYGKPYRFEDFVVPYGVTNCRFNADDLDKMGLRVEQSKDDPQKFVFTSDKLLCSGDSQIRMIYDSIIPGKLKGQDKEFKIYISPDPRQMWKDIPIPNDLEYYKDNTSAKYLSLDNFGKKIVAASIRGRSHAHAGNPRDDDFEMRVYESGWVLVSVADGAGSAKFSRQGSRLACNKVSEFFFEKLKSDNPLDKAIRQYLLDPSSEDAKSMLRQNLTIVDSAARVAYDAIRQEADSKGREIRLYATTLLFAIFKRIDGKWFVISFTVGDGVAAIFVDGIDSVPQVRLLGKPDAGEFAGQTKFLTMSDIFADNRIHFKMLDDFKYIVLMTDGVSDPKFETDENLSTSARWVDFFEDLTSAVPLSSSDSGEIEAKLQEWLGFYHPGNHDDRTIVLVY